MILLDLILETWPATLAWVAGFTVAFGVLVRLMPCNPGMYWWKAPRAALADLMYWFVVPLFMRFARLAMLILGVALLFGGREPDLLPVKHLPLWQQCLAILLIQDVILYAMHRFFHTSWAWKFHAVHHSPTVLDWTATSRFHPVNSLLSANLADVLVLLMGFSPAALVVLMPFNIVYSAMVHANLNWTFGPLRYLFASPVFHRWHHTTEKEGRNKNFASTFPILDVMLGTFHMPPGKLPEQFGAGEHDFPEGFWGQFAHPFRLRNSPAALGALHWAKRRPVAASLLGACLLGGVSLFAGGVYYVALLAERNEQLAHEVARAKMQQLKAESAQHAVQLDVARRAWADNDLVRATAILEEVAGSGQQTFEQQRLRECCRRKCLVLKGHAGAVTSVAICPDGRLIASGSEDRTVKVWDARTGKDLLTLQGHARAVRCVALSPDGRRAVSGSADGTVKVWDLQTGKEQLTLSGHHSAVLSVALSADGQCIVSGSAEGVVKVHDARSGQEKHSLVGDAGAVLGVAVSSDASRIVTASWWTAKVWDGTGQPKHTFTGHTDLVYSVAISGDASRIVTGSFDETVKVHDAGAGREVLTLKGHAGAVYGVALSGDGSAVVSGGKDRTVRVWDAATGREKLALKGHTDAVTSVAVSGDGQCIVSGSRDGMIEVWDARSCAMRENVDVTRRE
jgi:WD40 repeat protein/sterol desaturase/sphingolipid hydroxylase (fatty acid hydroxylase superfamily)